MSTSTGNMPLCILGNPKLNILHSFSENFDEINFLFFFALREEITNLSIAVFFVVLLLNSGAEVEGRVVYQIRRVLRQIQQHEIEVQSDHTTSTTQHDEMKNHGNEIQAEKDDGKFYFILNTFSYGNSRWLAGRSWWTTIGKLSIPELGTWFPAELSSRKPFLSCSLFGERKEEILFPLSLKGSHPGGQGLSE